MRKRIFYAYLCTLSRMDYLIEITIAGFAATFAANVTVPSSFARCTTSHLRFCTVPGTSNFTDVDASAETVQTATSKALSGNSFVSNETVIAPSSAALAKGVAHFVFIAPKAARSA